MERSQSLQGFLDAFVENIGGIDAEVMEASDHRYNCRCAKCLSWWASVGPEEEDDGTWSYGPFTQEEIDAFKKRKGV